MNTRTLITLALLTAAFAFSCKDDEPMPCKNVPLQITFEPEWNGTAIEAASEFEDQFGNRLRLFNFKTFIGEITLSNESEERVLSEVELLDFNEGNVTLDYTVLEGFEFDKLTFNIGVPAEYNVDYDPSTWPNSHPLSVQGALGMHWGWNTGYIFTKFDGKADTTDAVEPSYLYPFTFHCGNDAFYLEQEFTVDITSSAESAGEITIKVNAEKLLNSLNNIDIRDDGETHTGGDFSLAEDFMENFNTAFEIE